MPHIFPNANAENLVICVSGVGAQNQFTTLITKSIPDLHTIQTGQCFPLKLFESVQSDQAYDGTLFDVKNEPANYTVRDGLTDEGLRYFRVAYPHDVISKDDIFYYVYGLLHSPDYRTRYADNLSKELPRIPCVKTATDFWAFSKAGRALAELHLNYESVDMYPAKIEGNPTKDEDYRVEKMKYGKKGKDKDLSTLHYNAHITVRGIPLEAYEYIVNGKPALDWVVERQAVTTHKDSGIVNDANDWAIETMGNAKYPLELFLRVITVSLETMKIVKSLPELNI